MPFQAASWPPLTPIFNRPVPAWSRYRTPVKDLWMCGSATHPGGGIMGAPGRIAALELLKEAKRGRRAA